MSRDTASPPLAFVPRTRGAIEVATPKKPGFAVPVRDLAFVPSTGRIAALQVAAPGTPEGEGIIAAIFTTPLRNGRVRIPGPHARGWLKPKAAHSGLRWASATLGCRVLDCSGAVIGTIATLVVEHMRQQVVAAILDDGSRVSLDEALFLPDGRLLLEATTLVQAPMDLWLGWQDDLEEGRLWWTGELSAPPPLEPTAAAAAR